MTFAKLLMIFLVSTPAMAKDFSFVGQEYPPFNWTEGGEVKGGMIDVMKKACEKLKYNCKFAIAPLPRGIKMLEDGEVDGVMSLIPSAERKVFANFSPTIVVSNTAYFGVKGKVAKLNDAKDLDGWTIAGVRASASFSFSKEQLKQVKNVNFVEEVNTDVLVKKLKAGRYGEKAALVGGDAVLEHEAKQEKLELDMVLNGKSQGFATAFSKKSVDAQTLAEFTKTIDGMKKSGEMKTILEKFSLKAE